jgi:ribosome maturation protein SDO1
MPRIQQPVASVKLTNVATVRLTVRGQKFEIACYKNKILDYRAGLETDLSEVLQTDRIFSSVVKGEFASMADLQKAFGKEATEQEIAVTILNKGKSLQVSEGERTQLYESALAQVSTWLATNCFHKETGKPFTVSQIKQALTSSTFSVQPHKPIKQQYLQALKYLQSSSIPIQRAAMELSWTYDTSDDETVRELLQELDIHSTRLDDSVENTNRLIFTIDPSQYRLLNQKAPADSRIEVLRQHVMEASADDRAASANATVSPIAPTVEANEEEVSVEEKDEASDNSTDDDAFMKPASRRKKKKKGKQRHQKQAERSDEQRSRQHDDVSISETHAAEVIAATTQSTSPSAAPHDEQDGEPVVVKTWKCNSCAGSSFATASEYRTHFKCDWHRFNQKLTIKGAKTVTEEEFKSCDIDSLFRDDDYDT